MSTNIYRRVVHTILYRSMSTNIYIGGLSTNKTNIFVLKTVFFIHDKCMCEGVGEDSKHGTGDVDIQVRIGMILLECLCGCHCMSTYVGSNPCKKIQLLGIPHPVVGNNFRYLRYT